MKRSNLLSGIMLSVTVATFAFILLSFLAPLNAQENTAEYYNSVEPEQEIQAINAYILDVKKNAHDEIIGIYAHNLHGSNDFYYGNSLIEAVYIPVNFNEMLWMDSEYLISVIEDNVNNPHDIFTMFIETDGRLVDAIYHEL